MQRFIARANFDHYIALLNGSDVTPHNRDIITKLLIAEEDKLSHDLEHLEFAEVRTARSRDRVNHVRNLRDGFAERSPERAHADRLLANVEGIHHLLDQFCHRMREMVNSRL